MTRRLVAAGAMGSAMVAVGGFGDGALPARLAGTWQHRSTPGLVVSGVLTAAGLTLLLTCWWRLRGAGPAPVRLAAAAWSVPLLLAPPLYSRDVYAYAGQAHLVTVGLDPYTSGPADAPGPLAAEVDDVWAHARSPYGPVFLRIASLFTHGQHVLFSVVALRLLAVGGAVLLAWALGRLAHDVGRALWLGVANPLVLLHGIGGAHNDLLMGGLLAAGLAVATRTARPDAGGGSAADARGGVAMGVGACLIVLAALVKLPALAGLAFLPLLRPTGRARARAAVITAGSAAIAAVALTAATRLGWGWLHTLDAGSSRLSLLSVSTGLGVLGSQLGGSVVLRVAHAAGLATAAVIGVVLLVRGRRREPLLALGLGLLAAAALSPVVQPWYLLWSLAVLPAVASERLAVGLGAASAVLCVLILPTGRHLVRPPLYGVPAVLAVGAGVAVGRSTRRNEQRAPAAPPTLEDART